MSATDQVAATLHRGETVIPKINVAETIGKSVLGALQKRIGEGNAAKGFHEFGRILRRLLRAEAAHPANDGGESRNLAEGNLRDYETARLALITTEVAEAIEELRSGRRSDETWYSAKVGGSTYAWNAGEKPDVLDDDVIGKPEGVPSEIADVVIRAFDFAHEADFDLASIIFEKLAYNATRAHKHGRKF